MTPEEMAAEKLRLKLQEEEEQLMLAKELVGRDIVDMPAKWTYFFGVNIIGVFLHLLIGKCFKSWNC